MTTSAWDNILLHQNEDFSHSWFLNFDSKFKSNFPIWFLKWWDKHGPSMEIIPEDLQVTFKSFIAKYKMSLEDLCFPPLLHFIAKYKIPWILKWQYEIDKGLLVRQFFVKWWDKFQHERIISQVNIEFPIGNKVTAKLVKKSSSNLSIESMSKSELKAMSKQLRQRIDQMNDSEDEDEAESRIPSTSQQSYLISPPGNQEAQSSTSKKGKEQVKRWSDYQHAQDPYAKYDLESD